MPTREQITEIYENSMESQPRAGQDVREAYSDFNSAVDAYISALQYEMFLWAFELGYKHGKEAAV